LCSPVETGGERVRPYGPFPIPQVVHPGGWTPGSPGSAPVPSTLPRERFQPGSGFRSRPLRVFGLQFRRKPESARTSLIPTPLPGLEPGVAHRWGDADAEPFPVAAHPPGIAPRLLRIEDTPAFAKPLRRRSPIGMLSHSMAEASGVRLALAAGQVCHSTFPALARDDGPTSHRSRRISTLRPGARRPGDNFRSSRLRTLRPPKRRSALSVPPDPLSCQLSPSFQQIAPSLQPGNARSPGRTAPRRQPLRATAGQEALRSSPAGLSFLFRTCDRRGLSAAPAGPFPGDSPAFIDSRSGLFHQPDASVRVASR